MQWIKKNLNIYNRANKLIKEDQNKGNYLEIGPGGNPVDIPNMERTVWDLPEVDLNNISQFSKLRNKTFNLIILREVIEHLLYPREVLLLLNEILAENGKIIITTPNYQSLPNRIAHILGKDRLFWKSSDEGIITYDYSFHGHHYYFSPKSITTLLETSGFTKIKIKGFGFGLPGIRLFAKYLATWFPKLSDHIHVEAIKKCTVFYSQYVCPVKKTKQTLMNQLCTQPVINNPECVKCKYYTTYFLNPDDPRKKI